jgi:hypothetical protein
MSHVLSQQAGQITKERFYFIEAGRLVSRAGFLLFLQDVETGVEER